ncbi:PQQ-binding-like beta-propeller repeat protein [Cellulosimicrobium terreum]|nr:PQQ-binding-like beta-propeller repeat protein [Cellulosimicrobium terreum]
MSTNRRGDAVRSLELESVEEPEPPEVAERGDDPPPRPRRRLLAAGALVATLVAAFVASSVWQSWNGGQVLLDSRGGVSSLAAPPALSWDAPATGGQVWPMGDAVVVLQGDELVALDISDGSRSWSRAVPGTEPRCGPSPDALDTAAQDRLVCLTGTAPSLQAWVVEADGSAGDPVPLGAVAGDAVPGPDATVLRWARTAGSVTVVLQDAADGTTRWERTVAPDDVARDDRCRPQVANTAAGTVEHGLLVVSGCRVSAWFAPDGTRLDDVDEPATVQVLPTADHTYLRTTATSATGAVESTQVVRSDGTTERIVPGRPLVPLATDGTADPTRLLSVPSGIQAVDTSGNERWTTSGEVYQVAVAADGTAVLDLGWVVRAVDLASGETLWTWDRDDLGSKDAITAAFTDGDVALLVVGDRAGVAPVRLVALDLADGTTLWEEQVDVDATGFTAVDGHLVHVDRTAGHVVVHR